MSTFPVKPQAGISYQLHVVKFYKSYEVRCRYPLEFLLHHCRGEFGLHYHRLLTKNPRFSECLIVSHSPREWTSRCYLVARCYQSTVVLSCFGLICTHTPASPVGCIVLRPGLLRRSFRCQCCTCAWSIPVLDSGQICHFVLWIWSTPIHHNSSNSKPCNPFLYSPKSWPKHASVLHLHSTYHLAWFNGIDTAYQFWGYSFTFPPTNWQVLSQLAWRSWT